MNQKLNFLFITVHCERLVGFECWREAISILKIASLSPLSFSGARDDGELLVN
jgi:hypothetical protein